MLVVYRRIFSEKAAPWARFDLWVLQGSRSHVKLPLLQQCLLLLCSALLGAPKFMTAIFNFLFFLSRHLKTVKQPWQCCWDTNLMLGETLPSQTLCPSPRQAHTAPGSPKRTTFIIALISSQINSALNFPIHPTGAIFTHGCSFCKAKPQVPAGEPDPWLTAG